VYPRQVDGPGGQWEIAGESLTDKDYCNVEQTQISDTEYMLVQFMQQ